MQRWRS